MLRIDYETEGRDAVITWEPSDSREVWFTTLREELLTTCSNVRQVGSNEIRVSWWSFLSFRATMSQIIRAFALTRGTDWHIEQSADSQLKEASKRSSRYGEALKSGAHDTRDLQSALDGMAFGRTLTANQLDNVAVLASLPAAASFSVPGAGKSTEALATFVLRREPGDRLLVVCPKNAFGSWDEQLLECLPGTTDLFVRLSGGANRISTLLDEAPALSLITYQQLIRVQDRVAKFLAEYRVHLYLDESHRIKGGSTRASARSVLELAHLPVSKLILSGTPMPQAIDDLVPQFSFLYPEVRVTPQSVVDAITPIYVRTNKTQLGLREPSVHLVEREMLPAQARLYGLMRSQVVRDAEFAMSNRSKTSLRMLGRSVARLTQAASNPLLLADHVRDADRELFQEVMAEGESPKVDYVIRRARQLARSGQKVLIWTSFVRNVELLAGRLADEGAVYIHGGVGTGDTDDDDTREGRIRAFRQDSNVRVLVANPAAASESISLHMVCHHAIYLDRTFNAGHFLQSQDRIHRLGLKPTDETHIEIVESLSSIDQTIRLRLDSKILRMASVLKDSSLHVEAVPFDPDLDDEETPDDENESLNDDDIFALAGL